MSAFPFLGFAFGALFLFPILWFLIGIILAIWVYKDAEARNESGALWLLIVLITGILGLIIWLIVRPEKANRRKSTTRTRYCSNCGAEIDQGSRFCSECGEEIA